MIEVNNLTKNYIDKRFLKIIAKGILSFCGIKKNCELSIALVDEKIMTVLNKKYRGINQATDVLAFEEESKSGFVEPSGNMLKLGEIVICPQVAKIQAQEAGHSIKKELATLLIHGILHLLGYDHEKKSDEIKMTKKQKKILPSLKIN